MDYFRRHEHRIVPSSPVIPENDPTLLFTNAGMNQFKDVFTGQRKVDYSRAASVQKCIRAGGKHNDLDNVGFTARHHTFFEMLGNFSFGDYFKEQAIYYAWEWVTKELGLPIDKLYATVYTSDDEAFELWAKIAPPLKNGRILRFGEKENFWSMGEFGPCGPCSELHFDRGEKFGTGANDVINGETDRFVEIWNLVFMQYNQAADGTRTPLPKPSVDTGAGLERLAAIIQGADSNYGIDLFQSIIGVISELTHSKYAENVSSHHVIADHIRALTFAIADGAGISNEGQGYVLRRILRRAARHGRLLGMEEPFMYRLVDIVVETMGDAYPEIKEKQHHIEQVIKAEEETFLRTLETGCVLFDRIADRVQSSGKSVIDGADVFRLYDTYGFPYDLTEIMAQERGLKLDKNGFEQAMSQQREKSRTGKFTQTMEFAEKLPPSEFVRLPAASLRSPLKTKVLFHDFSSSPGEQYLVLEKSPFYVEAGGQISDTGVITNAEKDFCFEVVNAKFSGESIVLLGRVVSGNIEDNDPVEARIDAERRWDIMRNHTATHLAHAALRKVLGEHIKQSGSYVGPERLRFDFSHHQPMTPEEIRKVEELVNEQILSGAEVHTDIMDIEAAKNSGAMALFGEKYGEKVRVVSVADFSKELCGGTHVENVSQIGPFFITLETGIASGVRRLEAITGREAVKYMLDAKSFRREVAAVVGRPETEALDGVRQLREDRVALQKEVKKLKAEMFSGAKRTVGTETPVGSVLLVTHDFGETDRDIMTGWIDTQKERREPVVAVGIGSVNGKKTFVSSASHEAVSTYGINVGTLSREILPSFGGRGGGKPSFAQGSVAPATTAKELFEGIKSWIEEKVEKGHGK